MIGASLWLKINSWLKPYSMTKMEILCFVRIIVRHEKRLKSSKIWPILAIPNYLAKVKQKSQLKLLSANTNHHFL